MRVAIFLTVVPLAWVALHVYMGRRLLGVSRNARARRIGWVLIGLAAAIPPASMIAGRAGLSFGVSGSLLAFGVMGLSSVRKRSHPLGCRIPAPKPDLAEQGTWSWSWSWSWS
jgi:hypothetical protein